MGRRPPISLHNNHYQLTETKNKSWQKDIRLDIKRKRTLVHI